MIEKPIPREIRDFKEKLVLGLTGRQLIAVILALIICVPTYIWGRPLLGDDVASWICILAATPSLMFGFYKKNGMTFEQYVKVMFRFNFIVPITRKYKIQNFFEELEKNEKKNKRVKKGKANEKES